jgi:hypothetical protein
MAVTATERPVIVIGSQGARVGDLLRHMSLRARLRQCPLPCAVALALVGCTSCSGTSRPATKTVDHTVFSTVTDAVTPTAASVPARSSSSAAVHSSDIGRKFSQRGITATVTSTRLARFIPFDGGTKSAGSGATFAIIETKIVNKAKEGLDLTCGYPVANKLINDSTQEYSQIEDLFNYTGNPECNVDLQPGLAGKMTWVYRIPIGSHIVGWGFADATSLDYASDDLTVVSLNLS